MLARCALKQLLLLSPHAVFQRSTAASAAAIRSFHVNTAQLAPSKRTKVLVLPKRKLTQFAHFPDLIFLFQ